MSTFLMIHGAWHGGWCFEPLRRHLEARGHELLAPTLPGMGGRDLPTSRITLDLWSTFIADMALGQGDPVILCGHSRGGIVASAAAEREPSVIQALVYITAFMLPSGTSLRMFQAQAPNAAFDRGISPAADGAAVRFDPVIARSVLYHRAPRRLREAACARLVAEPVTPLVTPMSLTEARFGGIPRHYIECIDDRALLLARQREMQQRLPCASVTSLDSDHSPFLCCPASLANALMAVVV